MNNEDFDSISYLPKFLDYSPPSRSYTPRELLTRNWLFSCHSDFLINIRGYRANNLGCPISEVDPVFSHPTELAWLWERYRVAIQLFQEDNNNFI